MTSTSLALRAPLAPNINHRDTVFGDDAWALAILSVWSLAHARLKAEGSMARLVIQSNAAEHDWPTAGPFQSP